MANVGEHAVLPGASGFLGSLFGSGFAPYDVVENVQLGADLWGGPGALGSVGDAWRRGAGGGYISPMSLAAQGALYGFPGADPRESAIGRFADWGNSWDRWMGDLRDENGNLIAPGAQSSTGARMSQQFGGREGFFGNPINPGQSDLWAGIEGIGQRFGQDEYMRPGQSVDDATPLNQWRTSGEQGRYMSDPSQAGRDVFNIASMSEDPTQWARRGVRQTGNLVNQYSDDLTSAIDEEAQRSHAIQFPEVQQQARMMGLGEGATSERMGGDVARDVLGQAAREKARVLAGFAESGLGRQAEAINLRSQLGGQSGMQQFGAASDAYRQALAAREGSLDQIHQGTMGMLGQAQSDRAQTMRAREDAQIRGMLGADESILRRLGMESQEQSRGFNDWRSVMGDYDSFRGNRLQEMLNLSEQERQIEQQMLNQQMQFGLMPQNWLMQLISGVQTGGQPTGGDTSNWWAGPLTNAGANLGAQYVGSFFGGAGGTNPYDPGAGYQP